MRGGRGGRGATTRREPAPRGGARCIVACAAAGLLGWLPSAAGALDPLATAGWLAVVAVGAGWLAGALGARLLPALLVPGAWALVLAVALARSPRLLPTPLWALGVVAGLFLCGLAGGRLLGRPFAGAGLSVLAALALCGPSVAGALPRGASAARAAPAPLAAERPELARLALAVSPWVLVLESGGQDVTHSHPLLYRASGVEWLQRRPWRGRLAAPVALVVGSLFAAAAAAAGRARTREGASGSEH